MMPTGCLRRWREGTWAVTFAILFGFAIPARAQDAPAEPEKPALYSLPWLLRPAIPGNVVRVDETMAFYEDPISGEAGRRTSRA